MVGALRYAARSSALGVARWAVTNPLVRWTWPGLSGDGYTGKLPELRPADRESVHEMMRGRYLLAAKLVDTHGVSPFAEEVDSPDWRAELESFSWLRHFRDVRDDGSRRFARTLVLDWIGRSGRYNPHSWSPGRCAQRVMNWLRHYALLLDGASPEQAATIARALNTQVQSLRLRAQLITDPVDALLASIALTGAAICHEDGGAEVARRAPRLDRLLRSQIGEDGLHLSRNPRVQFTLLTELVSLRQALRSEDPGLGASLGEQVDAMHLAFDAVTLGTGAPAYFNGCGELPHDLIVALQGLSPQRWRRNGTLGGYGAIHSGRSAVVADGGRVPPPAFSGEATASALAIEFSSGSELVFGSCGPAPAGLETERDLFREGRAHSGPTIEGVSAATIAAGGLFAGRLVERGGPPAIACEAADNALFMRCAAYQAQFGLTLERRLTLLSDGDTLIGQDRIVAADGKAPRGTFVARFHLGPQVRVEPGREPASLQLVLPSGAGWSFIWEGAEVRVEDSVRQSALFGFHRTSQLVLEAPAADGLEIAWIFSRQGS